MSIDCAGVQWCIPLMPANLNMLMASFRRTLWRHGSIVGDRLSHEIDENGDLLVQPASGVATERQVLLRHVLLPKLEAPAWLDLAY